ncbi:MAG: hypothetical protein WC028_22705 [Candidatus Obscuribacterales bacterium]
MTETKPETTKVADSAPKKVDEAGDASLKLSLAGNVPKETSDKTKVTDAAAKPAEIDVKKQTEEIFGRITTAKQSSDALAELISSKKPMDEKVTVTGADGKTHQTTVGERIKELKQTVDNAANQAVVMSKSVDQAEVSRQLNNNLAERNTIAKSLGLDTNKLSSASITEALKSPADNATKTKLEGLLSAQEKVDGLKTLENAPAFTKLIYAQLKGGGFTNPNTPVELMPNGKLKVDRADITDAMSLIAEAGASSKELRNHPLYLNAVNEVFPRNENGSQKVQAITQELQNAIELGSKGNKVEQEKALKAAVTQADNINVPMIAQMVKDPAFANRQTPEVLKEMANTVVMAETARLQYAQFLAEQGRFGEAQTLTLRVKAECPDVMYNRGADGQIHYNDNRFVDLAKLDRQMAASSTFDPNKLNTDINNFRTQFQRLQGGNTDASSETKESAYGKGMNNTQVKADLAALGASMDGQLATQKRELTQSKQALDAEKVKLEAEQKGLGSKKFVTEEAGKIEAKRIEDQIKMIDMQKGQLEEQLTNNTKNTQLVRLLEASYDLSREDRSAANAKLSEIENGDPAFVAEHKKDLEQMREMAKEPGWWDSWGKKLCIVGAVVVGVAAGIWLGPGCIATGAAAGTAAAAALGVGAVGTTMLATAGVVGGVTVLGIGAGTVAAAGTGGMRLLADNTGGLALDRQGKPLYSQESIWRDMGDSFKVAGNTAALVALPGAAGAVSKVAAGTGEAAAVTGFTGHALNIGKVGATNLAFGTTFTLGQTAIEKISNPNADIKWTGHGIDSFGGQVLLNSAFGMGSVIGESGKIASVLGKVVSAERIAPTMGALITVGATQGISTYGDYAGVKEYGAAYTGFRNSQSVFGPWGYTPHDESRSLFQAGQVRANMQQLDQGQSYYTTKAFNAGTLTGSNSVFDNAARLAAQRDANK